MRSMASSSDYWRKRALADEEKAQQVAGRMLREQRKVYRQAYADIERALDALYTQAVDQGAESLTRTQLWQYSKYKQLKAVLQEQTGEIAKGQVTAIESTLERIFMDTIGAASKAFRGQDIRFNGVSDAQVKRLIKSNWSGESFSKRVWRNTREIARRVEKDVTDMMVLGKSPSAVKQQLMHDYNVGFRAADRLVRTEAGHAYNSAALESYRAAGVTQVEVLVGKDDRLCDECAGVAGVYDIDKVPRLPAHPHCRCTYAPVVDLDAEIKAIEAAKTVQSTAQNGIIKSITVDGIKNAAKGGEISEDVAEHIFDTLKKHDSAYLFNQAKAVALGDLIALQTDPEKVGTFFDTALLMNKNLLGNKSVAEIDSMFLSAGGTVANSLADAVIHEMYHAKLINGMNYAQVENLYDTLADIHIEGISRTAAKDGAECIAEVGVVLERGELDSVPAEALELFRKYIR